MLIIRNEQMEAFREARRKTFYRQLLRDARDYHPELCGDRSDEALLESIEWAAKQAKTYGLFLREDLTRFVHFVLRYGQDYETASDTVWAVEILNDANLVGAQKLEQIEARSQADQTS